MEIATLGGGCFWCLDAVYRQVNGVLRVISGYMGGEPENPTYEMVCTGQTGYAEVVRLEFDESVISYREILEIFFSIHNPTTLNRQGADVGTQYRSVIFTHSDEQNSLAKKVMEEFSGVWNDTIVTQIEPAQTFYPAEDIHQNFFAEFPEQAYCAVVIEPKVMEFRKKFASKLRK